MATSPHSAIPQQTLDPWLAVNYALIFPGLGQLYSRYWIKGCAMSAIAIVLLGYAVWSIFGANGNTVQGFWAIGLWGVLYSVSILDAYRGTQPGYATRISVPTRKADPWYAVFLSHILPGLGHLYLQQAAAGGLLLVLALGSVWLANHLPQLVLMPPLIWVLGCYWVYITASRPAQRQSTAIALLVVGLFLVRLTLGSAPGWIQQSVEQCIVPSDSMVPTLQVGDRLFVRRDLTYRPQPGDIIVFTPPAEAIAQLPPEQTPSLYVKRVIAVSGQRVEVANGQVRVNDQPLQEPYLNTPPAYTWGPAIVPADRYFVLGDNRNASSDSHVWGYVSTVDVLGRAYKIYWPPDRIQPLGPPSQRH